MLSCCKDRRVIYLHGASFSWFVALDQTKSVVTFCCKQLDAKKTFFKVFYELYQITTDKVVSCLESEIIRIVIWTSSVVSSSRTISNRMLTQTEVTRRKAWATPKWRRSWRHWRRSFWGRAALDVATLSSLVTSQTHNMLTLPLLTCPRPWKLSILWRHQKLQVSADVNFLSLITTNRFSF